MKYDIEHRDARFEDEDDAVVITHELVSNSENKYEFWFKKLSKREWQYVELRGKFVDDNSQEPGKKIFRALFRDEQVERILAADGERVMAEKRYNIENCAYKQREDDQ